MLELASNNSDNAKIKRVSLRRPATDTETQDTDSHPILETNSKLETIIRTEKDLDDTHAPSLKTLFDGPFCLRGIYENQTDDEPHISFELRCLNPGDKITKQGSIITEDRNGIVVKSIAVLKLTDIFAQQLAAEIEHYERLLQARPVVQLSDQKALHDAEIAESMMKSFLSRLNSTPQKQSNDQKTGKALVESSLSTSISATGAFYDAIWSDMRDFYSPTIRHIAETQTFAVRRASL